MVEEVEGGEAEEEKRKKTRFGKAAKVSLGVLGGLSLLMGYISAAGRLGANILSYALFIAAKSRMSTRNTPQRRTC